MVCEIFPPDEAFCSIELQAARPIYATAQCPVENFCSPETLVPPENYGSLSVRQYARLLRRDQFVCYTPPADFAREQ